VQARNTGTFATGTRPAGAREAEADIQSEIPEKWRAKALGQIRTSSEDDGISGCHFQHDDFCHIEDDATPEGQYIDLSINPERFTGYAGDSANQVWRAIYQENCFGLSEASFAAGKPGSGAGSMSAGNGVSRAGGFGLAAPRGPGGSTAGNNLCEETKLYYRVISGLHASISIHICADYLDQKTGEWAPNLSCFISRVATHPERLSNVYFNAVLLLRAVARAAPYLRAYDIDIGPRSPGAYCPASIREADAATRAQFESVLSIAERSDVAHGFDESHFFNGKDAPVLMDQFKTHFRNVSRIMDCVGCDKCRLWGKLQVTGIGTALKILFALDDKDLDPKVNPDLLQRSEVVALFNALHRLSESLAAVEDFRQMYAKTQTEEAAAASVRAEEKAKRAAERAAEKKRQEQWFPDFHFSWSAVFAALLSALEAVRRSCTGCVQVCVRTARELLGAGTAKTEL